MAVPTAIIRSHSNQSFGLGLRRQFKPSPSIIFCCTTVVYRHCFARVAIVRLEAKCIVLHPKIATWAKLDVVCDEVCFSRSKANEQSCIEPRPDWPCGSPCASPQTEIDGEPGDAFTCDIEAFRGYRFLPVIHIRRAA